MPGSRSGVVLRSVPVIGRRSTGGRTRQTPRRVPTGADPTEHCSHDDVAQVMRRNRSTRSAPAIASRLGDSAPAPSRRRVAASLLVAPLLLPLVFGLFGARRPTPRSSAATSWPTPRPSRPQLKKEIADQKAQVAELNALQAGLAARSADHASQLNGDQRRPDRGQEEDHHDGGPDRRGPGRPTTASSCSSAAWTPSSSGSTPRRSPSAPS